jgi:hypothetical protein
VAFTDRVVGNDRAVRRVGEFPLPRGLACLHGVDPQHGRCWWWSATCSSSGIGLGLALLVNQRLPGRGLIRSALMLPWAMPAFVAFLAWRVVYQPIGGGLNLLLTASGIWPEVVDWLGTRETAMPSVIVASVWRGFPFWFVSILGGRCRPFRTSSTRPPGWMAPTAGSGSGR